MLNFTEALNTGTYNNVCRSFGGAIGCREVAKKREKFCSVGLLAHGLSFPHYFSLTGKPFFTKGEVDTTQPLFRRRRLIFAH